MRLLMTIPFLVALIAFVGWLIFAKVQKLSDPWAAEVCRVVFFAATLVTLWGMMNKVAF
jgi:hypothetical protein